MSEADTCRKYIVPKLYNAGWDDDHIREQVPITDGRIMLLGQKQFQRKKKLKPDYILDYMQPKSTLCIATKPSPSANSMPLSQPSSTMLSKESCNRRHGKQHV